MFYNLFKSMVVVVMISICFSIVAGEGEKSLVGYWKFNDGTGSAVIKDTSDYGNNGIMLNKKSCSWAREDDRGFFLQFAPDELACVEVKKSDSLDLKNAFSIIIKFSCDLDAIRGEFSSLLCKGIRYSDGYCIMIKKNGDILVNLKGVSQEYELFKGGIQSNREYVLAVIYDGKTVNSYLNGKSCGSFKVEGDIACNNESLFIGGLLRSYLLKGNIYMVKIYNKALSLAEISKTDVECAEEVNFEKPVFFYDFEKMSPAGEIYKKYYYGKWWLRKDADFMAKGIALHPPDGFDCEDIRYSPALKGNYDLYIGMRTLKGKITSVQLKTSSMEDYFTIKPGSSDNQNIDILWAKNINMDGQDIIFHPTGNIAYIGYLKFVPVRQVANTFAKKEKRLTVDDFNMENIKKSVERIHMDNRDMPQISQESERCGYIVFPVNYMDLIFPNTIPEKDAGKPEISINLAKGEYEPLVFCLRTLRELKEFSIKLDGALHCKGEEIPVENISLGIVECLNKRTIGFWGDDGGEYMLGPQYIEQQIPDSFSDNSTKQFWITVKSPVNISPGVYQGALSLKANGIERKIILKVNVYPFQLDEIRDLNIGMTTCLTGWQNIEKELIDMKEHGMTSIYPFTTSLYPNKYFEITGNTPSDVKVDFGNSPIFKIIDVFHKLKFTGNVPLRTDEISIFCKKFLPDEEKFENAYVNIIRQIEEHCMKKNYNENIYTCFDEVPSNPENFPALRRELKAQKKAGVRTLQLHLWYKTSRPIQDKIDECVNDIDIFGLRYNSRNLWYVDSWEAILEKAKVIGKEVYAYNSNNCCPFAEPATMRFIGGWFFRTVANGCKGHFTHAYQLATGNPYNDLDGWASDFVYYYPPLQKRKGGPSIGWECYREGIDDLKYIYTLEAIIKKCKKNGLNQQAANAEKLLEQIQQSFDIMRMKRECTYLEQKWEVSGTLPNGKKYAEGKWMLPNGWDFEDYDEARRKIAGKIIELTEIMRQDRK